MRTLPRKLRAFRPSAAALEARNAVSSLLAPLGLAAVAAQPTAARPGDVASEEKGRPVTLAPTAPAAEVAQPRSATSPTVPVPARQGPADPAPERGAPQSLSALGLGLELADLGSPFASSVITLSQPSLPAQPRSGPMTLSPSGVAAPSAPAVTPASPPRSAEQDGDGIRPMTLAPTAPGQASGVEAPSGTIDSTGFGAASQGSPEGSGPGGSGLGYASGSGGNPTISSSNVPLTQTGDDAQGRHYKVDYEGDAQDGKVPVGKIVRLMIAPPSGPAYQTITWSGGTDFSSYYNGAAKTEAPTTMQVTRGVATDKSDYAFIVDPDPKQYNIKVSVTYAGGGAGSADFTFTSVKPDVTLTPTLGTPKLLLPPATTAGTVAIRLDRSEEAPLNTKEGAGMRIDAETTTKEFGGQFMFMQVISPVRLTRREDDVKFRQTITAGTLAIDNSFTGFQGASRNGGIGYPITDADPGSDGKAQGNFYFWISGTDETETHTMADNPVTPGAFLSNKTLQVGDVGAGRPERFDTFVMYKPTQDETAAWVAIGKVHWEWGALAGNNPDGKGGFLGGLPADWALTAFPNVPAPTTTIPVGASEFFPGWTDRTTDILKRGNGGWVQD